MDETIVQLRPNLRRAWYPSEIKPICPINWTHAKEVVYGAWNPNGGGFMKSVVNEMNSEQVIEFIKSLMEKYGEFVLVMDSAPWHKSKRVCGFLDEISDCVNVIRLPRYSPEENPCEQYWRVLKQNLANRLFVSKIEFKEAVCMELESLKVNINLSQYLSD